MGKNKSRVYIYIFHSEQPYPITCRYMHCFYSYRAVVYNKSYTHILSRPTVVCIIYQYAWIHQLYFHKISWCKSHIHTETLEFLWCQLCRHWRHRRLSSRQPPVPPVTTKLASWQLLIPSPCLSPRTSGSLYNNTSIYSSPLYIRLYYPLSQYSQRNPSIGPTWFSLQRFGACCDPIHLQSGFGGKGIKLVF